MLFTHVGLGPQEAEHTLCTDQQACTPFPPSSSITHKLAPAFRDAHGTPVQPVRTNHSCRQPWQGVSPHIHAHAQPPAAWPANCEELKPISANAISARSNEPPPLSRALLGLHSLLLLTVSPGFQEGVPQVRADEDQLCRCAESILDHCPVQGCPHSQGAEEEEKYPSSRQALQQQRTQG
eukprot:scaffold81464_cov16-Tisochrysis_lutea.AAC.2